MKMVYWSGEDKAYVGRCPGLFHGGVYGGDEMQVYADLTSEVDEWGQAYRGGWLRVTRAYFG